VLLTLYTDSAAQQKYLYFGNSERVWGHSNNDFTLWSSGVTWSYPYDGLVGLDGLYGGIRWAVHPELCDRLLPMFLDGTYMFIRYVHCTTIRDAIAEAFSAWSHNHPLVQFHDVSDQCTADSLDDKGDCSHAQLTISFGAPNMDTTQAAYVEHDIDHIETLVQTTSQVRVRGLATRRARMVLSNTMCWYMDSTFCVWFHRSLFVFGFDVLQLTEVIMYSIECACVMMSFHVLFTFVAHAKGHESYLRWIFRCVCRTPLTTKERSNLDAHTPRERIRRDLNKLSSCALLGFLFVFIFIPIFHTCVFLPCKNCHGFNGVLAHEIGHVIGFHHPDERPRMNLIQNAPFAPSNPTSLYVNCSNPWHTVQLQTPPEGYDSIMNSKAKHRKTTCLTQNDVDGLYSLYPICDKYGMMVIPAVSCIESLKTQGILRLIVSVAIPFFTVSSFVIVLLNINKHLQARRNKTLEAAVQRRAHQAMWLRASNRANWMLQHSLTRKNLLRQTPNSKPKHFHRKQIDRQHGAVGMVRSIFGQTPRSGFTPRQVADLCTISAKETPARPKNSNEKRIRPSILPKEGSRQNLNSRKLVSRQAANGDNRGNPIHSRASPPKRPSRRLANRTFDASHANASKMIDRRLSKGRLKPDNVDPSQKQRQRPVKTPCPDTPNRVPTSIHPSNMTLNMPSNSITPSSTSSSIPEDTIPTIHTTQPKKPLPQHPTHQPIPHPSTSLESTTHSQTPSHFAAKPSRLKRMLTSKPQNDLNSQLSNPPPHSLSHVLVSLSSVACTESIDRNRLSEHRTRESKYDPNQLVVV
jgi:hypothetical protein